jgi:hypothetical protein
MGASANVQSIQSLDDLRRALGRFQGQAQEALDAAEQEIRRTLDWLQERHNHWLNEVHRRQEVVRQAQAALARCQASGSYDKNGYYHAPNCSAYERALREAQTRLREAEAELANVRHWLTQVQEAVAAYHLQARRLEIVATTRAEKAKAFLGQALLDLERYMAVALPAAAIGASISSQPLGQAPATSPAGITWAEKRSILDRVDAGLPITVDDLRRLQLPVSDLQVGTLADDDAWLHQVLESERFREAMRDSQEAENLQDALVATLKALGYWRSKT